MQRIDLPRSANLGAHLRAMVEAGVDDGPAEIYFDGSRCLLLRSIHRAACLTVSENPSTRFVPYEPHPARPAGPRVAALLAADKHRRAHGGEAPETASHDMGAR